MEEQKVTSNVKQQIKDFLETAGKFGARWGTKGWDFTKDIATVKRVIVLDDGTTLTGFGVEKDTIKFSGAITLNGISQFASMKRVDGDLVFQYFTGQKIIAKSEGVVITGQIKISMPDKQPMTIKAEKIVSLSVAGPLKHLY